LVDRRQAAPVKTGLVLAASAVLACTLASNALGQVMQSPHKFPGRAPIVRQNRGQARAAGGQQMGRRADPEAIALLRQMLRPAVEYAAEEMTWIAQGGGTTSHQTVKGDTKGNVLRRYTSPPFLAGDVMLTGPNKYVYYRASTKTVTVVPPAGGAEDERDKTIVLQIKQRNLIARRTGNETVAGINATIVLVTPVNPQQGGYAKFWIDPVTHIKLKIEIANAANAKISTSELSNIVTGPAANVLPRDFMPGQFGAGPRKEVQRQRTDTIQDAANQLSFRPVEPASLPMGFRLDGAYVLKGPIRVGLLLRYTDGVSFFTLTEHQVGKRQRPAVAANGVPHWFYPTGEYQVDVVYRGHLPAEQEKLVHESLKEVK